VTRQEPSQFGLWLFPRQRRCDRENIAPVSHFVVIGRKLLGDTVKITTVGLRLFRPGFGLLEVILGCLGRGWVGRGPQRVNGEPRGVECRQNPQGSGARIERLLARHECHARRPELHQHKLDPVLAQRLGQTIKDRGFVALRVYFQNKEIVNRLFAVQNERVESNGRHHRHCSTGGILIRRWWRFSPHFPNVERRADMVARPARPREADLSVLVGGRRLVEVNLGFVWVSRDAFADSLKAGRRRFQAVRVQAALGDLQALRGSVHAHFHGSISGGFVTITSRRRQRSSLGQQISPNGLRPVNRRIQQRLVHPKRGAVAVAGVARLPERVVQALVGVI